MKLRVDIFDIPVYRVSQEEYDKEWQSSEQFKTIENLYCPPENVELNTLKIQAQSEMIKKFGGCWRYNDVIGYIRLYVLGNQIRGEYYCHHKRITKIRRQLFEFKADKLADEVDLDFSEESSNEDIFLQIIKYINSCRKELNKKSKGKRYIYSSLFEKAGKYIDWKLFIRTEQGY